MQTKEYMICINDDTKANQVREESKNPSLQIKVSRVSREYNEEKIKQIL